MKYFLRLLIGAFLFVGCIYLTAPLFNAPMGVPASVVRVDVHGTAGAGHGTGFYIGDGQYITAGHVATVSGVGSKVVLHLENNGKVSETTATVVWADEGRDVAMLKADNALADVREADLACDRSDAPVGTSVVSIGYPMDLGLRYSWGNIASAIMKLPKQVDPSQTVYIGADMQIAPGNSGGPVFDNRGRVVGLSDAALGGETLLVPRSIICQSMEHNRYEVIL